MTNAEYYRQMYHTEVFKMFAGLADKLNGVKSTRSASTILRNFLKKTLEYPMVTDEGLVGWGGHELAWRFTTPTTLPDVEFELAANGHRIDVNTYVPTNGHLLQKGWKYTHHPIEFDTDKPIGTHVILRCRITNPHAQEAIKNLVAKLEAERGTKRFHKYYY